MPVQAIDITATLPFPFHPPTDRGEGIHLTDVIKSIHEELFPADAYTDWEDQDADERARTLMNFEMGYLWEDTLSLAFGDRLAPRFDNVLVEGILCNPDGVVLVEEPRCIREYKCTKMSMLKDVTENWRWQTQTMGYCYAFGVTVVEYQIMYINGDYRKERGPCYRAYRVVYKEQEIQENWMMIKNHAKAKEWI